MVAVGFLFFRHSFVRFKRLAETEVSDAL